MTGAFYDACLASHTHVYLDGGSSPEWTAQCPSCSGEVQVRPTGMGALVIERHRPAVGLNGYVGVHIPACYARQNPGSCICPGADLLEPVL